MYNLCSGKNNIIKEYESTHSNIKIKWIDVPFSEGEKRTLAAVMTDCPPDLINLNPDFSAILAQKGTLWEIDESKLSEFTPEIVEALKYNDQLNRPSEMHSDREVFIKNYDGDFYRSVCKTSIGQRIKKDQKVNRIKSSGIYQTIKKVVNNLFSLHKSL